MNFKELYTKNNINYNCGKLFGPFPIIDNYTFYKNKKGAIIVSPIRNKNYIDKFYAEIDGYNFFYDIIYYGNLLYNILKTHINPLRLSLIMPPTFEDSIIQIVSEESIRNCFSKLKDICTEFLNKYTYCFVYEKYFPSSYKHNNQGRPISFVINHILLIFMFHTVFQNLSTGYESFKEIYESLSIDSDASDSKILNRLINYVNIYSSPDYHITSFHLLFLRIDDNVVPITVTNNLFAFAFEVLQNNIATRSFYEYDGSNDVHSYNVFRKCARCLKNLVDLETDRQAFYTTLKSRKIYCDDCKKELKRISSNKYEHSIRTLYDKLKNNIDKCNPKLANEIKNLLPKDKETKTHLEKLYNEYQLDITKNNKKRKQ